MFENIIKVSIKEFDINTLQSVSLLGYTGQSGSKITGIRLQTLQDKDMILLLENIFGCGISSARSDRLVKPDETKVLFSFDANNLYGHSMAEA